jgi:hypothetical protein
MRILVAGWFSFENGHATAGDVLARDLACTWLAEGGYAYDIAVDPIIGHGVDIRSADPSRYSHLLFVCGPFEPGELSALVLTRYRHCRLIGLDLTMPVPLDVWNPWDLLVERDSSRAAHPDMVFATRQEHVPVVGICLVEEYPGASVAEANAAIQRLVESRPLAIVPIDTRLDTNSVGLRSPAEIESLIARMDAVVTTRLHGAVLALKNGVPPVMIDPEAGGAKIARQAALLGWPLAFTVDGLRPEALRAALDYCLTDAARAAARACGDRAAQGVGAMRAELLAALASPEPVESAYHRRISTPPPTAPQPDEGGSSDPPLRRGIRTPRGVVRHVSGRVSQILGRWR